MNILFFYRQTVVIPAKAGMRPKTLPDECYESRCSAVKHPSPTSVRCREFDSEAKAVQSRLEVAP